MQRITIEVEQYSDLQLLLRLAERIGLRVIAPAPEEISPQARKNHLAINSGDVGVDSLLPYSETSYTDASGSL